MQALNLGRVVGMSAYELAVSNGYEGTLESWLESLRYDHSGEYKQFTETIEQAKQDILSGKEEINSGKEEIKLSMTQIRDLVEKSLTDIGNAKKAATEAVKSEETEAVSNINSTESAALSNIGDAETNALTSLANTLDSAIRSINEKGTRWEKQIEDTGTLTKSEYNQNAIAKQKAFDDNAQKKQSAFDTHVAETQTTLDQHIKEKQDAFDSNAVQKTKDFDEHTEQIQADIGQLKEDIGELRTSVSDTIKIAVETSDWENGGFDPSTGKAAKSEYLIRTIQKPISSETKMAFAGNGENKNLFAWFYDKDRFFISRTNLIQNIPDGACYVAFSFGFSSTSGTTVESYGFENLVNDFAIISESKITVELEAINEKLKKGLIIYNYINSSYDLNDLDKIGVYRWNTDSIPLNSPVDIASRIINVPSDAKNNAGAIQLVISSKNVLFIRYMITSNWTNWSEIADKNYIDNKFNALFVSENENWEE